MLFVPFRIDAATVWKQWPRWSKVLALKPAGFGGNRFDNSPPRPWCECGCLLAG
jgi:hypothetical protein